MMIRRIQFTTGYSVTLEQSQGKRLQACFSVFMGELSLVCRTRVLSKREGIRGDHCYGSEGRVNHYHFVDKKIPLK